MSRSRSFTKFLLAGACLASVAYTANAQETVDPDAPDEESRQQTVVIRGQFIPDEVRSTSEVSALIDEEDFAIQGDSDAAAALARVAGISTAEDSFIYVRGLNERYSSATLNGSPLPSPAPLRRVAPLDLFPTSALDSVLVQKTFSPNLPGEFGGGLVDLRTKAIPNERFLTMSVGAGYNTESSLQTGLLYDGGDNDWLGFDDGSRDLPAFEDGVPTPEFGRQLIDNSSLLILQEGDTGPDFSFGLTLGERIDVNDAVSMGILAAVSYDNAWKTQNDAKRGYAVAQGPLFEQEQDQTTNTVGLNGLLTVGFDLYDNHEIKLTGLVSRSSDKRARTVTGENADEVVERVDSLEWFERQLWTTQITGEHFFDNLMGLEVGWRASYSEALRDAPYQLSNTYRLNNDNVPILGAETSDNEFQFSRVDDDTTDFGIDLTLPLENLSGDCTFFCEVDLKAGYAYVENDRFASARIFGITGIGSVSPRENRVDYLYNLIFANGAGNVQEVGNSVFPPLYVATLEIDAAYAGIDAQITPYLRAAAGVRVEQALQAVDTRVLNQDMDTNFVESCIERQDDLSCDSKEDILPAFTLTWNPLDDLQVRAGYSETLTRPQFRELAPAEFLNTETNINFVGNPFLENAAIKNYDVRGEYYFARDQFIRLGFFYKEMENPVEEIQFFREEGVRTTFSNAPSAELFGVELEYEQVLPMADWFGGNFWEENEFQVKTNYTWSDSEVTAGRNPVDLGLNFTDFCNQFPAECVGANVGTSLAPVRGLRPGAGVIENGRRLQGQSEHLFNLQMILTNEAVGSQYNLLLNYVSERIRTAGAAAAGGFLPDIVEEPPMTLDFVYNRDFEAWGGDYAFSLNIENILGDNYEAYQTLPDQRVDVDTYDLGTVISFGLTRKF